MSYIGIEPSTAAFPFDQFSGNGTTTAFTMSYAPASTTSMVVCISGVVQNPNTYAITGLTLTFSQAPPTGTNNIGVLYLGIPATSVVSPGNTAYLTTTSFTATAGQTTFTPSAAYQVGYINVIRNGSQLAPADFTATNGTTVVLNNACVAGDVVVTQGYTLSSIANALPSTGGTVTGATTFNSSVTINGGSASGYTGYKNRIINGGMVIDQRNNGASITPTTGLYSIDRWAAYLSQTSKYSVQRNAGSVTPPTGFSNYLGITSLSSYSVLTGDFFTIQQSIEGYNISDLGFGTASASSITLSFWVRSSLTGTFSGSICNTAASRNYIFNYTISSANTWTAISVTIPGDTTGTWATDNTTGLAVRFGLGCGATYSGAAGSWGSSNLVQSTGSVSVVGTSGATWYVTGVQLERGSNATSFEFRDYGRELQMCQRYLPAFNSTGAVQTVGSAYASSTTNVNVIMPFMVQPRIAPTGITTITGPGFVYSSTGGITVSTLTFNTGSLQSGTISAALTGATAGSGGLFYAAGSGSQILFTGCEL